MTASYWEIGRRIVEAEQKGRRRAGYGEQLMARLSADLTARFGRGFSPDNLRCLVIIDLKLGSLTHADGGQMHRHCNDAKEHWAYPDENPPVGLILCADKGHALARYALDGLPSKVMAANYRTVLPDAELLQKELENTRRLLASRATLSRKDDKLSSSRRRGVVFSTQALAPSRA